MILFNVMNPSLMLFRGLVAMAAMTSLSSCAVTYQFDPIEAWVVDAETGKPIEGAVVTANWELVKGSLDGPRYYGQLEVKETVTDKNGRFFFEGFSRDDDSWAELRESDPQVLIFKAGYEYQRFSNDYRDGGSGLKKLRRTAAVNGKTVKLLSMLSPEANKLQSRSVYSGLGIYYRRLVDDCYWKSIPRAIVAMDKEYKRLKAANPNSYVDLIRADTLVSLTEKCGSSTYLFQGQQK